MPTHRHAAAPLPSLQHLITLDEHLRMVPTDPAALRHAVETLQAVLNEHAGQDVSEMMILRRIGVGLTALGRYDEAAPVLERAVELAVSNADPRTEIAARINLGDALRYADDMDAARDEYTLALRQARAPVPDLLDFALQHQGKYFIDAGQPDDAIACLQEALHLRQKKRDPNLIKSTTDALNLARSMNSPSHRRHVGTADDTPSTFETQLRRWRDGGTMDAPEADCWLHPDLEVRPSRIAGKGLFARAPIPAGTIVSRLGGRLVSWQELQQLFAATAQDPDHPYIDTITVTDTLHLVLPPRRPNGYGNHSCDPNLWWVDAYTLAARRDIAADEEVTNDYAASTSDPHFAMDCSCGSPLCRGTVTGNDWRLPELQQRYGDHWAPALITRIRCST